ncbi:MAG: FAD-dependent oxidoreductase, partial [Chthoniobacteraceae bacterium]
MADAFRWYLTNKDPILIEKPDNYDLHRYEIFRRGFHKGVDMSAGRKMHVLGEFSDDRGGGIFGGNSGRSLWAQSVAGENAGYPDGDWTVRSRIWREQMDFVRGMYHFLRTDPSVPEEMRVKAETTGFKRGIFNDTNGWPHQLYVREARRMKSACVVTQKDLEGANNSDDSVGLGSYGVDDWPYATIAHEGGIAISGGEFSILKANPKHDGVHKIPYHAITPKQSACENLLVPVCCSASHIARTSTRPGFRWWCSCEDKRLDRAFRRKESCERVEVWKPLDFLGRQVWLGEDTQPLRVRHPEPKQDQVANIAKDRFEQVLSSGMRVELSERLVGESQVKAEFSRLRKQRGNAVGHEVLKLIHVEMEWFAAFWAQRGASERGRKKLPDEQHAEQPRVEFAELAFG